MLVCDSRDLWDRCGEDPEGAGRASRPHRSVGVRDTTTSTDWACACYTQKQYCFHHQTKPPITHRAEDPTSGSWQPAP